MGAMSRDGVADGPAQRVLVQHERLIRWQIAGERAGFALKVLTALAGITLAVVLGALAWSASKARGLVVEEFTVPPAMAERGLDGRAVAGLFLDKLAQLQADTDSGRAPQSYANNWGDDLSVEIANTGVSVGEIQKVLRGWLGNEQRMSGGVSSQDGMLSVVVRTGAAPIEPASGPETALDAILQAAAERVYEQTQPYRYSAYLARKAHAVPPGEEQAALRAKQQVILQRLTASPDRTDRIWAYNGLAVTSGTPALLGRRYLNAALAIDPDHAYVVSNLYTLERSLGHDEVACYLARRAVALTARPPADVNPAIAATLVTQHASRVAACQGDFAAADQASSETATAVAINNRERTAVAARAVARAAGHDPEGAAQMLTDSGYPGDAVLLRETGNVTIAQANIALERGDWVKARVLLLAADTAAAGSDLALVPEFRRTVIAPRLAYATARVGDLTTARAIIAATPSDCHGCVIERARIAELAGARVEADRWFAQAVRLGPSLPFAQDAWAKAAFARGDLAGAIRLAKAAHAKGPKFADPLKTWGDALMAQGKTREAARRYDQALALAPAWADLRRAHAAARRAS